MAKYLMTYFIFFISAFTSMHVYSNVDVCYEESQLVDYYSGVVSCGGKGVFTGNSYWSVTDHVISTDSYFSGYLYSHVLGEYIDNGVVISEPVRCYGSENLTYDHSESVINTVCLDIIESKFLSGLVVGINQINLF